MMINTNDVVSITEANQNFSAVARKVDAHGEVVVFRNNRPAYVIYSMENRPMELSDKERFEVASRRVLTKYHDAFVELAK